MIGFVFARSRGPAGIWEILQIFTDRAEIWPSNIWFLQKKSGNFWVWLRSNGYPHYRHGFVISKRQSDRIMATCAVSFDVHVALCVLCRVHSKMAHSDEKCCLFCRERQLVINKLRPKLTKLTKFDPFTASRQLKWTDVAPKTWGCSTCIIYWLKQITDMSRTSTNVTFGAFGSLRPGFGCYTPKGTSQPAVEKIEHLYNSGLGPSARMVLGWYLRTFSRL